MLSRATIIRSDGLLAAMARCNGASRRVARAVTATTMKTSANQRSFSSKIINPYFIPLFPSDAARPKPESNGNSNSNSNNNSNIEGVVAAVHPVVKIAADLADDALASSVVRIRVRL
mmetsp:Transcript_6494/g.18610  ORF Transcript_6494/g.18610 Transcript_6494/m.18610 type:complete len:117 (+) Transcript_6494:170-520(+)